MDLLHVQLLVVLLSFSFTEANYCNIFSREFQQQDVAHRCNTIYKAVVKALWKNDEYKYILREVFSINSFHRPPTAIIFHYKVKITDEAIASRNDETIIHVVGPVEVGRLDENDNVACGKENCTFIIGWSSASIYTFIRPEFILSLQPAWFLNSLKFSIHEHIGFLREVTLHVHLRKNHLPKNTTTHEILHSLERATAKIKVNNTSSTYIWKPISKTDPTRFIEIIYTMIVLIISLVSIIFLFYIIPYTKSDDLCEQYPLVWIGFALQCLSNIGFEIYHLKETYDHGIYGNMRIVIMVVAQLALGVVCMIFVFLYKSPKLFKTAYYAVIITFGWYLSRQLIMLFFFTSVYSIEAISTVGIVAFGIIFAFIWAYLSKGVYEKVLTIGNLCVKCLFLITYFLIDVFVYFSINAITYFTIIVYITFLNSLPKSPDSLVLQLICAFFPPLLAAGFTIYLKWWTKKEKGQRQRRAPRRRRYGYTPLEDLTKTI